MKEDLFFGNVAAKQRGSVAHATFTVPIVECASEKVRAGFKEISVWVINAVLVLALCNTIVADRGRFDLCLG